MNPSSSNPTCTSAPSSSKTATVAEVTVVRHGERVDETTGDEFGQWISTVERHRAFDPPLTTNGYKQAEDAAKLLFKHTKTIEPQSPPFDVIFCSPTLRCFGTASRFSQQFNIPIKIVPALGECAAALRIRRGTGHWNSLLQLEQLQKLHPQASVVPMTVEQAAEFKAKTGSCFIDYQTQETCIGKLIDGRERVLIVTHREAIRDLNTIKVGQAERLSTPYCCIARFTCTNATTQQESWEFKGLLSPW